MNLSSELSDQAEKQDFTIPQAAAFLEMSPTLLVCLLEEGEIPSHDAGSQKVIYLRDLLTFRAERERRYQVMAELVAETEALGLYS